MLNKAFTRRIFIVILVKLFLFVTIIFRLFYLQIKENNRFNYLSNRNRTSFIPLLPKRGIIFDYFKQQIANNVIIWELFFIKSNLTKPLNELLQTLSKFIEISPDNKKLILKNYKIAYTYEPILIKSSLTQSDIATIETYHSLFPEVFISASHNRNYLYPEQTAHIIGYIGQINNKNENKNISSWLLGKQGIELSLDRILKGDLGYNKYEIDSKGKVVKKLNTIPSTPGYNITLTIDIELQNFIYNLLKHQSASSVVVDIESGEILASVSTPSFNPNKLSYGISVNEWKQLINNTENPLNNRALSGLYPPASTIKPFVALLGLEKKVFDINTKFECKGYMDIGKRRFHCWSHKGHGSINVTQALINSCDIFFYNIGILMQKHDLNYLGKLLQISNNLLPIIQTGVKGNLPIKLETPPLGELAIAAIGQGGWLMTPLHLANMAAILANKGIIKELKILKEIDYKNKIVYSKPYKIIGSLPFSEEYITLIQNALNKVIKNTNSSWALTGKTGTAQVVQITEEQRLKGLTESNIRKYKEHAVFMGYVPFHNPKYAISVVIEHVGFASVHAVPVAKKISNFMYNKHSLYEKEKIKLKEILSAN